MNWKDHVEKLLDGETVRFRPKGNSMRPMIESGNQVTVEPIKDFAEIKKGNVVFCKVKGNYYVHLVTATQQKMGERRFQIGNYHGHTNGWIGESQLFGKVTKVEE